MPLLAHLQQPRRPSALRTCLQVSRSCSQRSLIWQGPALYVQGDSRNECMTPSAKTTRFCVSWVTSSPGCQPARTENSSPTRSRGLVLESLLNGSMGITYY